MKRFFQIWWAALAIKTVLAVWLPFSNDESYYWVWGHHPQWSYFDHPPLVGWLFYLGSFFESFGNGARLPGVWLGHLTLLIWAKILQPFLEEKHLPIWLIFMLLSPFFGLGSLIITPDVPLVFFWSLSLYLLLQLLKTPTFLNYCGFGAALGLGFCSKYMIVLFVPIACIWIAFSKDWRRIRWSFVPATICIGLIFSFPVLYWNSIHDWASFRFQFDHGLSSEKWSANWPVEYVFGQIMLLFPTVVWLARKSPKNTNVNFLLFFGWLPLAFFFYSSFKAHVEANWPIMAHPALLALAFCNAPDSKFIRRTAAIWAVAGALVLSEAAHHWLPVDPEKLKTSEFTKFDLFLPLTKSKQTLMFGSYQMASSISYKTRHQFYKIGGMNRRDFYDFLPQSFPDHGLITIAHEINMPMPAWLWEKGFVRGKSVVLTPEFQTLEVHRAKDFVH